MISNNDESEYNEQISEVVLWCKAHNLLLNAAKTKALIFDFGHCNISHVPLSIDNSIVESCDNFKYLGITFECKLKWSNHCTLIVSKCKTRLFFRRLLNSFGVKNDILHIFYTSMIESIICYNIILWWSSMNENDKKSSTIRKLCDDPCKPKQHCNTTANHVAHQLLLDGRVPNRQPKVRLDGQRYPDDPGFTRAFTTAELDIGIRVRKNGKAPGLDDIQTELIKQFGPNIKARD